jgi:uncharacterized protein YjbJ (UPF0337 family)
MRVSTPLSDDTSRAAERENGRIQSARNGGDKMNTDILQGKWKQMRGEMKRMWGQITDDEFDKIEGDRDKLIGVLQEKYGYSREKAEEEVGRCCESYEHPVRH